MPKLVAKNKKSNTDTKIAQKDNTLPEEKDMEDLKRMARARYGEQNATTSSPAKDMASAGFRRRKGRGSSLSAEDKGGIYLEPEIEKNFIAPRQGKVKELVKTCYDKESDISSLGSEKKELGIIFSPRIKKKFSPVRQEKNMESRKEMTPVGFCKRNGDSSLRFKEANLGIELLPQIKKSFSALEQRKGMGSSSSFEKANVGGIELIHQIKKKQIKKKGKEMESLKETVRARYQENDISSSRSAVGTGFSPQFEKKISPLRREQHVESEMVGASKLKPQIKKTFSMLQKEKEAESLKEMERARYREQTDVGSSSAEVGIGSPQIKRNVSPLRQEKNSESQRGKQDDNNSSCSDEDEDEVGIKLTPQIEKNFFHALACLKREDPSVYDKNHKFFEEPGAADLAREKVNNLTTSQYAEWLQGNKDRLGNMEEEANLKTLRDFWTNPELDEGEAFIRKYLFEKPYLANIDVPASESNVSDDEERAAQMEDFENRYNMRYEEPDSELCVLYPKTMKTSSGARDMIRPAILAMAARERMKRLEEKNRFRKDTRRQRTHYN